MRKYIIKIICILIVALSVILSGCSSTNLAQMEKITDSETLQDEVNTSSTINANISEKEFKEISVDEAYKIFISIEDYLFIDVRLKESYDESHVEGAISIPGDTVKCCG